MEWDGRDGSCVSCMFKYWLYRVWTKAQDTTALHHIEIRGRQRKIKLTAMPGKSSNIWFPWHCSQFNFSLSPSDFNVMQRCCVLGLRSYSIKPIFKHATDARSISAISFHLILCQRRGIYFKSVKSRSHTMGSECIYTLMRYCVDAPKQRFRVANYLTLYCVA